MDERDNRITRTSGLNTWRAGCGGSRTSGSEGGPEKPTHREMERALRPDPYTEFATDEGKLYLAGVRDLCHRGLVGWAMDEHQDAELVVDALVMALGRCTPDPDGLIHHADRGSQYLSLSFCATANLHGLQVSFGSTGDCFDNAAMETFWSTVKREIRWTRGSDPIHHSTASPPVLVRVVRGVLQPSTPPNRARPPNPDRVRRYVQFAITPCPRKRVKVTATSAGVRWPSAA